MAKVAHNLENGLRPDVALSEWMNVRFEQLTAVPDGMWFGEEDWKATGAVVLVKLETGIIAYTLQTKPWSVLQDESMKFLGSTVKLWITVGD